MDDGVESDIAGATSSAYTLTADDYAKKVKVRASFTDRHNNAEGPLVSDFFPESGDLVLAAPSGVGLHTTLNATAISAGPISSTGAGNIGSRRCMSPAPSTDWT